ncbi:MAG: hypothetical protein COV72_07220 [Candidatus Omnitrophica bacterium CG11_big_fil_rev_8_21_14_0_20_42_13]|uniref:AAA+ ATPase domain-containing protein n=1 Tax=Candidatus Ghiorseimicrobium undicola TaxID=1974746 RepID=A0A2H0LWF1_9BACT|nr:MAG: hypothetical protein COV72_07220 [Candidatus Omnitrophica bacterium CG11_big_fil_rev_8_21_14_0_20_42_13]
MQRKKREISETILVGRGVELEKLKENIKNKKHTSLTGDIGTGKTHLLKYAVKDMKKVIYVERIHPLKTAVLEIAFCLHKQGKLAIEGVHAEYLEWRDLKRKVTRLPIAELLSCILDGLFNQNYILVLDHLEGLTPSMAFTISCLMDKCLLLGATNDLKKAGHLSKIWWRFEHIEIKNLDKEDAKVLLWLYADKERIKDEAMFENKVLTHSCGNPLAIVEMARRTGPEKFDDPQKIRDLRHDAGVRYFDLSPCLLFIGAIIVAVRFISLGLNDTDGYILAGSFGAFFIFLRFFIYKSMREA